METPIPQSLWKFLFHGAAAGLTVAVAISLLRERRAQLCALDAPVAELRKTTDPARRVELLHALLDRLAADASARKGTARMAVQRHLGTLIKLLRIPSTDAASVAEVVGVTLKVLMRSCNDAEGRKALYDAGGYRALMGTLSEAHKQGHRRLMEDTAVALHMLTAVDDDKVVLPRDVPFGAEGAYALSQFPSTVKMLRVLDPHAPLMFLNAITGVFANVCALDAGAQAIGKGTGDTKGIVFFLNLLEHGNQAIVEHCVMAVRFLVRAGVGQEEVCSELNVKRLDGIFDVHRDPKITSAVLTTILIMLKGKHRSDFCNLITQKSEILQTLFIVWCRGTEKPLRDRAEVLVHLLERVPECTAAVRRLFEQNRTNILERRQKDEEARRKEAAAQRERQMMMQRMMMMQGGGGGGGGGPDMESLMAMMGGGGGGEDEDDE